MKPKKKKKKPQEKKKPWQEVECCLMFMHQFKLYEIFKFSIHLSPENKQNYITI